MSVCGDVMSAVDRVEWFTTCKVASLAVRSSAMQTEGCGILIMFFDVPMVLRAGKMSEGSCIWC